MVRSLSKNSYYTGNRELFEKSFQRLFADNYDRLLSYASKILNDSGSAEDIIQEVFITFWEKRDTFSNYSPEGFLFIMTRNKCFNYLKQASRIENSLQNLKLTAAYEELYRIDYLKDEPLKLIADDLRDHILSLTEKLPPVCANVFRLRCIQGFSNREIASQLSCSLKNVEKHLKKARSIIASSLKNHID